jgi:hypothetical protein
MELTMTRLSGDEPCYTINIGQAKRFCNAAQLKQRLLDLGVGDSTIAAVLDLGPNEMMTVQVAEKVA